MHPSRGVRAVSVGDRVWLDDGKFGGVARRVAPDAIEVEITQAPPGGGRLRAEKGINLPDTTLSIAASRRSTTTDDRVRRRPRRHGRALVRLDARGRPGVADVLARNGGDGSGSSSRSRRAPGSTPCPSSSTEALAREAPCGVMIARGDLAVEVGWERMAEIQEEILWLCEAAHVPVIWATQVLDTLARTGIASRAEITDAASGARAECVMLNKGPMILAAIATLDDILARMETHRHKKTSLLRRLRAWNPQPAT